LWIFRQTDSLQVRVGGGSDRWNGTDAVPAEPGESHMDCPAFTLTLPSESRMLTVARTFVEAVCQAHCLERTLTHSLVLVAGEAFTNIVRHAHRNVPEAQLEIRLQILPNAIALTFEDEGAPFDLAAVPELDPGELRIGGRGVYLMRTLMDELSCQPRPGQAGNTLRLVKRLHAVQAAG
jgi:serine/threonine-protein kinase RsbW